MNRKRLLPLSLTGVAAVLLCWLSGGLVSSVRADKRQEILRPAEVLQWKPGSIVADSGAGDAA
jgi:hypothetical protein